MLAATAADALEQSSHRTARRDHVGVESAGIERFLDRWPIGVARESQRAAQCGGNELRSMPARARAAAAEWRNGYVNQLRIDALDLTSCESSLREALESPVLDKKIGRCEVRAERLDIDDLQLRAK